MKRIILTLTVLFSLTSMSSFAGEETVSPVVLESFKSSFKNATEVDWTVKENLYKAHFAMDGQYITVFYSCEGEMMAMTKNMSAHQLPIALQVALKNEIENQWITELFEVANEEGTTYYVTLENADTKLVLKASSGSSWTHYQKANKS